METSHAPDDAPPPPAGEPSSSSAPASAAAAAAAAAHHSNVYPQHHFFANNLPLSAPPNGFQPNSGGSNQSIPMMSYAPGAMMHHPLHHMPAQHPPPHIVYHMMDNHQPQGHHHPFMMFRPPGPYVQQSYNQPQLHPMSYAPYHPFVLPAGQSLPAPLQASHHLHKRSPEDALSARSGDSEDKQPKKRRKKDPKAPKNPVSAYLFYVADQRVKNTGKSEGKSFAEVAKDLGRKWKNLNNEEKEPYIRSARKDKERYEKEKANYKSTRLGGRSNNSDSVGSQNLSSHRDSRSDSVDMQLPAEIEVSLAPNTRFVQTGIPPSFHSHQTQPIYGNPTHGTHVRSMSASISPYDLRRFNPAMVVNMTNAVQQATKVEELPKGADPLIVSQPIPSIVEQPLPQHQQQVQIQTNSPGKDEVRVVESSNSQSFPQGG